jgi:hypothetical protein
MSESWLQQVGVYSFLRTDRQVVGPEDGLVEPHVQDAAVIGIEDD